MILGRTAENKIKIKTDGGLRAVGCACCGGARCLYYGLYPASGYDFLYDRNDLPASLTLTGAATPFDDVVTVFKNSIQISISGLIELLYVRSIFWNEYDDGYYEGGWGIGLYQDGWKNVYYTQGFDKNWFEDTKSEYSNELVANFPDQYRTLDYFASSYNIVNLGVSYQVNRPAEIDPYYNDIIVPARNRICNPDTDPYEYANPGLWENLGGDQLYFGAVRTLSDNVTIEGSCKWTLKNAEGIFRKIGQQDTPLGSYEGNYTVS